MSTYINVAVILLLTIVSTLTAQSYRAGVVVFKPIDPVGTDLPPDGHVTNNTLTYVSIINKTQGSVDILVFPEYGITNIHAQDNDKDYLSICSMTVGNESEKICGNNKTEDHLRNLSCAAEVNKVYVIANVVEKDGDNYFVTTIGLDPEGSLCLKCRKHHFMKGTTFTRASDQKRCTFTAKIQNQMVPFTVLFGTDILYSIPADIKTDNVIMTSSIKNTLPLNIGFSLYQGFALSNGVNLLASGYYEKDSKGPFNNYGGSGIYFANGTSLIAFKPNGTEITGVGTVLKAVMPVKSSSPSVVKVQANLIGEIPNLNLQYMNIPGINDFNKSVVSCIDPKKCCTFNAELTDNSISPYKWVVLSNKTTIVDQEIEIFLCALITPSANALKTFKNISISSNLDKSKSINNFSLALGRDLAPIEYVFNKETNSITLSKEETVVVFGILQVMNTDSLEPGTNVTLIVVITLLCIALVGLLIGFLIWRKKQNKNRRAL